MRSLIVSGGVDPNGEALRFKAAADRHGGASIRAVTRSSHGFKRLPVDIAMAGNGGAVRRLWQDADVIHLNNRPEIYEQYDDGQGKPALLHHHGQRFRTDPEPLLALARQRGWQQAASTLDLAEIAPDVVGWLPTAYDLNGLAMIREEHRLPDTGVVRIAHAPTFRQVKGTEAVVAAVETLQAEGLPLELDLIERVSWNECLRRKASADLLVDQLYLGYGCNAIEAWGMGLPVVSGVDPEAADRVNQPIPGSTRDRMIAEWDGLPFYEASEATLTDALRALVTDEALRMEWAQRGLAHVRRFHAELPAIERLVGFYRRAVAREEAVAA